MQPLLAAADLVAQRRPMCAGWPRDSLALLYPAPSYSLHTSLVYPTHAHAHSYACVCASTCVCADDEGEFEVVEELGFYTEVGLGAPRAEDKNKNANLEHSIGYRIQRIKGHFVTPSAHQPHPHRPRDGTHPYRITLRRGCERHLV